MEHPVEAELVELELRELIAVKPSTTVRQAVELMRAKRLGCVVIVDEDGKPLGKFTERLLIKLLLNHENGLDYPVADYMASAWAQIQKTDPISKVIDCMESKALRFIVIVDDQGKAIAMTGQKGVMEYIADYFPRQVKVQRMRSKLFMDQREGA